MKLGDLIREYRDSHELSQRQFANACDLSNGYISILERGVNPNTGKPVAPTLPQLKKLADGMGITLSELFDKVDDMPVDIGANLMQVPEMRKIPLLGAIACGAPILAQQNIEDYVDIPKHIKADFALIEGNCSRGFTIPTETVVTVNDKGEEKIVENKLMPSYVLVKMTMTDESWHVVRNITGVTGFVGPGSEPTPLTEAEVDMFNIEVRTEGPKFNIGDIIEVVSGIFQGYKGKLQSIDEEKKQVMILASTEKREIPIFVDIKDIRVAE